MRRKRFAPFTEHRVRKWPQLAKLRVVEWERRTPIRRVGAARFAPIRRSALRCGSRTYLIIWRAEKRAGDSKTFRPPAPTPTCPKRSTAGSECLVVSDFGVELILPDPVVPIGTYIPNKSTVKL